MDIQTVDLITNHYNNSNYDQCCLEYLKSPNDAPELLTNLLELVDKWLSQNDIVDIYLLRAIIYYDLEKTGQATVDFQQAYQMNPFNPILIECLRAIFDDQEEIDKMLTLISRPPPYKGSSLILR